MPWTLIVAEAVDRVMWDGLASGPAGSHASAVTLLPSAASDDPPPGMPVRALEMRVDRETARDMDHLVLDITRAWHRFVTDLPSSDPLAPALHDTLLLMFDLVECVRTFHLLGDFLDRERPDRVVVPEGMRPPIASAVSEACRQRGIVHVEAGPARRNGPSFPALRSMKDRIRREIGGLLCRRRVPAHGPVLLWSYPKISKSSLIETLAGQGAFFLLPPHIPEEPFFRRGIRYARLALRPAAPPPAGLPESLPLDFTWKGSPLSFLLRSLLARVLPGRLRACDRTARVLAAYEGRVDLAVTPDSLDGANGVVQTWAARRGIPSVGIQHGAPLFDYWKAFPGTWHPGPLLVWGGERNIRFYSERGYAASALLRAGSADNDRFTRGLGFREARGNLILCTLNGWPFASAVESSDVNVRLLKDLLAAAAAFPDMEVVVKPHPLQSAAERRLVRKCLERYRKGKARLSEGESIDVLLGRARILATRASSTAVEAGLAGIPVLHLDYGLDGHPWYTGIMHDPGIPSARDAEGIRRAMAGLMESPQASARPFALAWEAGDGMGGGRAAARILDLARGPSR